MRGGRWKSSLRLPVPRPLMAIVKAEFLSKTMHNTYELELLAILRAYSAPIRLIDQFSISPYEASLRS